MFSICSYFCTKSRYHPERISKIKPFINKHNWKDIDFPAMSKDWKNLN